MNTGDLLICRGDIVHRGVSYKMFHVRLHWYLDNVKTTDARKHNQTYFIKEDLDQIIQKLTIEEPPPLIEEQPPLIVEPIIEEPTIEKTIVEEPTIEETIVEEPTIEETIVEEPTIEETIVEESLPSFEEHSIQAPSIEKIKILASDYQANVLPRIGTLAKKLKRTKDMLRGCVMVLKKKQLREERRNQLTE